MSRHYEIGDLVYCTEDLFNDGFIPDVPESGLLAATGTRGVVVKVGFVEADEGTEIYLVRFEGPDQVLGPPVGCLAEELTQDEAEAKSLATA
ncbi:MAG: nitrogen fixation protein NifZ [Rhodocyclaceae bacterium]|nr:nitrogen fixation protein NifZ [Rhodocyclaceae bacterium]